MLCILIFHAQTQDVKKLHRSEPLQKEKKNVPVFWSERIFGQFLMVAVIVAVGWGHIGMTSVGRGILGRLPLDRATYR